MTPEEINVQARKDAAVVIELCAEGKEQPLHFWKCLAEMATLKCCPVATVAVNTTATVEPFTDEEAHRFERFTTLRFGKYKMQTVLQVVQHDPSYIEWIADNWASDRVLQANARRYVNSKRFRDMSI